MMTISGAIGAGAAERYHEQEYANAQENYYTRAPDVVSFWAGRLAAKWDLNGAVAAEDFRRLARGCHPHSGEQLIGAVGRSRRGVRNRHRAAFDMTLSAPKSVSITAILGGRQEVLDAHRTAVREALSAFELFAAAHLGGNRGQEHTANLAIACFEHDTARPVEDRPGARRDVQLHTHCLAFNMTEASDKIRALEARELFRTQKLATAVYRATLARELAAAGYDIVIDATTGAPEIAGYSAEYLRAASQRSAQRDANLERMGLERRAGAAQRAVRINRAPKRDVDPAVVRAAQLVLARQYGDQHRVVIERMLARGPRQFDAGEDRDEARAALEYALVECTTRTAITTMRDVLAVAIRDGMLKTTPAAIRAAFVQAVHDGTVVPLAGRDTVGIRVTTREMIRLERACVETCLAGRGTMRPLLSDPGRVAAPTHLSDAQRKAFHAIARQRDRVYALQGLAGVGKTHLLATLASTAHAEGYQVIGLAPSGVAAAQLTGGGIAAETLQLFVQRGASSRHPRLIIVDETSLASTRMVRAFLDQLGPHDRVLLVGDVAQHESVEAGRMFAQLQKAGLGCAKLTEIRRQQDPTLRDAVEDLAARDVGAAIAKLRPDQIREWRSQQQRFEAIAEEFAREPEGTLIIAPTHHERREITARIRERLRAAGALGREVTVTALDPRNDYTAEGLKRAYTYTEGDVVRYRIGSKALELAAGSYARVAVVDATHNRLAVETPDGRTVVYDPARLCGVEIYRERERQFAVGDRIMVTLAQRAKRLPKSTVGTIEALDETTARVRLDGGRTTTIDLAEWRHVDHAFVLTSYAAQSLTTSRVLVHVDTRHAEQMINDRFAYVAASRAVHEAIVFTDRADALVEKLGRRHDKTSAVESLEATLAALRALNERVRDRVRRVGALSEAQPTATEEKKRAVTPTITLGL